MVTVAVTSQRRDIIMYGGLLRIVWQQIKQITRGGALLSLTYVTLTLTFFSCRRAGETEQIAKAASKPVTEALVKSNFHLNTVHFINENLFDLDFLADTKHDAHESVQK